MVITQRLRTGNTARGFTVNRHEELLGIYPKVYKSFYYIDTCMLMFIAALFTIARTWNKSKCPSMIDWIKKM